MTGNELFTKLVTLTPEQRKLPVQYHYYTTGDEMEGDREGDVMFLRVDSHAIHLSDAPETLTISEAEIRQAIVSWLTATKGVTVQAGSLQIVYDDSYAEPLSMTVVAQEPETGDTIT